MVDRVASEKWVPTRLVVGIANAESSIWLNFNKWACSGYNNWFGLKGRKYDDGKVVMYALNRKKPDSNGCYLYKFSTLEEWVRSLVNTISMWYKGCKNDVKCISYDYCGDPAVSEKSWVSNVERFYKPEKSI
jgi:uncharacterized FlgJ-related protein